MQQLHRRHPNGMKMEQASEKKTYGRIDVRERKEGQGTIDGQVASQHTMTYTHADSSRYRSYGHAASMVILILTDLIYSK